MSNILEELKRDFGLATIKPVTANIGGHVWSLRPLDSSDMDWATGIGTNISGDFTNQSEIAKKMMGNALKMERAHIAIAICAIDDSPVYDVFDVPVGTVGVKDVHRPPLRIRHEAARRVFEFLSSDINNKLTSELVAYYNTHVEPILAFKDAEDRKDPLDG